MQINAEMYPEILRGRANLCLTVPSLSENTVCSGNIQYNQAYLRNIFHTVNGSVESLKVATFLDVPMCLYCHITITICIHINNNNQIHLSSSATDRHDALFVVGSLDETLELRGLRYHPIDIETSVSRAHRSIAER